MYSNLPSMAGKVLTASKDHAAVAESGALEELSLGLVGRSRRRRGFGCWNGGVVVVV